MDDLIRLVSAHMHTMHYLNDLTEGNTLDKQRAAVRIEIMPYKSS
jgi:hypothetical protein